MSRRALAALARFVLFAFPLAISLAPLVAAAQPISPQPPGAAENTPVSSAKPKVLYLPGAIRLLVPPPHPAVAGDDAPEVSVEVSGTVPSDGRLTDVRIVSSSPNPHYEAAVRSVMGHWLFSPRLDQECTYQPTEGAVVIWFEKVAGKPKVSFSIPQKTRERQEAAGIQLDRFTEAPYRLSKRSPAYPKEAIQRGIEMADFLAHVRVDPEGRVRNVAVAPARHRTYFESAIRSALENWKFTPGDKSWCGEVELKFRIID